MVQTAEAEELFYVDLAVNECQRWLEAVTRRALHFEDYAGFLHLLRDGVHLKLLLNLLHPDAFAGLPIDSERAELGPERGGKLILAPNGRDCVSSEDESNEQHWLITFRAHCLAAGVKRSDLLRSGDLLNSYSDERIYSQINQVVRTIKALACLLAKVNASYRNGARKLDLTAIQPLLDCCNQKRLSRNGQSDIREHSDPSQRSVVRQTVSATNATGVEPELPVVLVKRNWQTPVFRTAQAIECTQPRKINCSQLVSATTEPFRSDQNRQSQMTMLCSGDINNNHIAGGSSASSASKRCYCSGGQSSACGNADLHSSQREHHYANSNGGTTHTAHSDDCQANGNASLSEQTATELHRAVAACDWTFHGIPFATFDNCPAEIASSKAACEGDSLDEELLTAEGNAVPRVSDFVEELAETSRPKLREDLLLRQRKHQRGNGNVATVIKSLQFVAIKASPLAEKAKQQIEKAEKVKKTVENHRVVLPDEADAEWRSKLENWKTKRRQCCSKSLAAACEGETNDMVWSRDGIPKPERGLEPQSFNIDNRSSYHRALHGHPSQVARKNGAQNDQASEDTAKRTERSLSGQLAIAQTVTESRATRTISSTTTTTRRTTTTSTAGSTASLSEYAVSSTEQREELQFGAPSDDGQEAASDARTGNGCVRNDEESARKGCSVAERIKALREQSSPKERCHAATNSNGREPRVNVIRSMERGGTENQTAQNERRHVVSTTSSNIPQQSVSDAHNTIHHHNALAARPLEIAETNWTFPFKTKPDQRPSAALLAPTSRPATTNNKNDQQTNQESATAELSNFRDETNSAVNNGDTWQAMPIVCSNDNPTRRLSLEQLETNGWNGASGEMHFQSLHICIRTHKNDENGFGFFTKGGKEFRSPVLVNSLSPGGSAEKAGLQLGDELVAIDGMLLCEKYHAQINMLIKEAIKIGEIELDVMRACAEIPGTATSCPSANRQRRFLSPDSQHSIPSQSSTSPRSDVSKYGKPGIDVICFDERRSVFAQASPSSTSPSDADAYNANVTLRRRNPGRIENFVPECERDIIENSGKSSRTAKVRPQSCHGAVANCSATVPVGYRVVTGHTQRSPGTIYAFVPECDRESESQEARNDKDIVNAAGGSKQLQHSDADRYWKRENQRVLENFGSRDRTDVISPPPTRNYDVGEKLPAIRNFIAVRPPSAPTTQRKRSEENGASTSPRTDTVVGDNVSNQIQIRTNVAEHHQPSGSMDSSATASEISPLSPATSLCTNSSTESFHKAPAMVVTNKLLEGRPSCATLQTPMTFGTTTADKPNAKNPGKDFSQDARSSNQDYQHEESINSHSTSAEVQPTSLNSVDSALEERSPDKLLAEFHERWQRENKVEQARNVEFTENTSSAGREICFSKMPLPGERPRSRARKAASDEDGLNGFQSHQPVTSQGSHPKEDLNSSRQGQKFLLHSDNFPVRRPDSAASGGSHGSRASRSKGHGAAVACGKQRPMSAYENGFFASANARHGNPLAEGVSKDLISPHPNRNVPRIVSPREYSSPERRQMQYLEFEMAAAAAFADRQSLFPRPPSDQMRSPSITEDSVNAQLLNEHWLMHETMGFDRLSHQLNSARDHQTSALHSQMQTFAGPPNRSDRPVNALVLQQLSTTRLADSSNSPITTAKSSSAVSSKANPIPLRVQTNETERRVQSNQQPIPLSVSGRQKCSHCGQSLDHGAAMIIESLKLFYHLGCFKCYVCGKSLGDGAQGADVRVRSGKLHCRCCYSNDEAGLKYSEV